MPDFPASRAAALDRLAGFVPKAGRAYAAGRNYDYDGAVSALSPYLRHRVITEAEVLRAIRAAHGFAASQKFIQEVYWRTYWKGWLEHRPALWDRYKVDRAAARNAVQTQTGLRQSWEAACTGQTGIDAFDHWARQLVDTGYLHNHARMWFASIWVFTLRLPWALGADFFLRHLLDGCAASNTLSWRWVAGMQTMGKTYLARPDNIETYTQGRFRPKGLASFAPALHTPPHPPPGPLPSSDQVPDTARIGLLLTEDDLGPNWIDLAPAATAGVLTTQARSDGHVSPQVSDFASAIMSERVPNLIKPDAISNWVSDHQISHTVMPYMPVGPTRDMLWPLLRSQPVPTLQLIRPYDQNAWPHATKGFFKFKDAIPKLLAQL